MKGQVFAYIEPAPKAVVHYIHGFYNEGREGTRTEADQPDAFENQPQAAWGQAAWDWRVKPTQGQDARPSRSP